MKPGKIWWLLKIHPWLPWNNTKFTKLLKWKGKFTNYQPQQSCGQGNVFIWVCHSVHRGVSASVHAGIPHPQEQTPPGADTPGADTPWSRHTLQSRPPRSRHPPEQTPPRSRHPPEQTPPRVDTPLGSRLWHTVNEWPVHILLECILVWSIFEMANFFSKWNSVSLDIFIFKSTWKSYFNKNAFQ